MVINVNQSYWQKTTKKRIKPTLQEDMNVDIVIIGGGLAGVSLAYQLKNSPYRIIVVDKDEIGSHTSGHTTAKVTTLHGLLYHDIVQYYDVHKAYLYFQSNQEALESIKEIIKKEKIDCDYQENNAYIYTQDPHYVSKIQKQKEIFELFRIPTLDDHHYLSSLGLSHQGIFHPLKYLYALMDICEKHQIQFYEHSEVTHIERHHHCFILDINHHRVKCQYLIHATRYPFIKKGLYFLKMFQSKEYIDCIEKNDNTHSYLCVDHLHSYRPIKEYHLSIHKDASDWYAQDSIPLRGIPYIGSIDEQNHEFIIYGFQKWGMTLSQVAAKLISDLILEKDNPYENLYSCHYFNVSFSKQYHSLMLNHLYRGYIKNQFVKKDRINKQEGCVIRKNGRLIAAYKDKKGKMHYFSPYCPHMLCIIEFDKKSQTWRCPCHQSIYDAYGKLIEGPSLRSLTEKQD